jgi:glycosyltransferase involved in cell wall biosynthesis
MKPRIFITIDTYAIGGAGKCVLQFLKYGGLDDCLPVLGGFWRGPEREWEFRKAVEALGCPFEVLTERFRFDPGVIGQARDKVREYRIDSLQSHGYKGHIVCLAVKKMMGLPWVAFVHGWTTEDLKVRFYNQIDRSIVRFADRIVPVSGALRQRLKIGEKAGRKIITIQNAADLIDINRDFEDQRKRFGLSNSDIVVGVVGRLSPEKGHRYFVEAFALAVRGRPKLKAIFVGDGPEKKSLIEMIANRGLGNKIILAGYQEDVSSFYHAFDVVALPSLMEGMPNAALEAMMFAKPVVASRVGGIPEVVLECNTGILVEPRDPAALAEALCELIDIPQRIMDYGKAGKMRAASYFSPSARTARIISLHRNLGFPDNRGEQGSC